MQKILNMEMVSFGFTKFIIVINKLNFRMLFSRETLIKKRKKSSSERSRNKLEWIYILLLIFCLPHTCSCLDKIEKKNNIGEAKCKTRIS